VLSGKRDGEKKDDGSKFIGWAEADAAHKGAQLQAARATHRVEAETPAPYPEPEAEPIPDPDAASSTRSRVVAFLLGVTIASVFGYFRVQQDIWKSGARLSYSVQNLHHDLLEHEEKLQVNLEGLAMRLKALEAEVARKR
jgi:ferric-dicitrate binding protein FerR (iron transport regulator)